MTTEAPPGDPTPRWLFVVIRPDQSIAPNDSLRVDVPIDGSVRPDAPLRLVSVTLQAATTGSGASQVILQEGAEQGGAAQEGGVMAEDAFAEIGPAGGTVTYDQQIASTDDVLSLVASTTAEELRLSSIGLSADIDP